MRGACRLREAFTGSVFLRRPPKGCRLCWQGLKTVVFITGLCPTSCYYCPISPQRRGRDVMYANERPVRRLEEVVDEALRSGSEGIGVTGGEPALVLDRVVKLIRLVKTELGDDFHVHLYTSGASLTVEGVESLAAAGLDELRFHPVTSHCLKLVEVAVDIKLMDVGVEIPMIPGEASKVIRLLSWLEDTGVRFLNLNELEMTEGNERGLRLRGFRLREGSMTAVDGSMEDAFKVMEWALLNTRKISVHFCTALYKDVVQTRRRLRLRGLRTATRLEEVTDEGLTVKLVLVVEDLGVLPKVVGMLRSLRADYEVIPLTSGRAEVYVHPRFLEGLVRLSDEGLGVAYYVEEYPVEPRLRVHMERLDSKSLGSPPSLRVYRVP